MQNSYNYWRRSHPLVFIAAHLMMGVLVGQALSQSNHALKQFVVAVVFAGSLVILLLTNYLKDSFIANGLLVNVIMVLWGIAIQQTLAYGSLFSITYPEKLINYCRGQVIQKINKTILNKEANGFSLALLLGVKSDMDKSLVLAYTQLGIIHIVAISGMHLEILFKNLTKITKQLPRHKFFLALELVLLLVSVWTYTLMAYASPSIVRASLFFTMYLVGKFIGAKSFTLNIIAGGLLVLILFDNHKIHHIGLQLSYGAVIGIHLFYKIFYKLLPLDNPLIAFLWSNCCMSLAAQLTTFPILVYHFKYISSWVIVSNFIMVPLSNIILYSLGILLLLPYTFHIANYGGKLVEHYILFLNGMVQRWYTNLNVGSVSIKLSILQIVIYYFALLCIYLWLYARKAQYLFIGLWGIIGIILLKLFS